jgi:hypothetical protein
MMEALIKNMLQKSNTDSGKTGAAKVPAPYNSSGQSSDGGGKDRLPAVEAKTQPAAEAAATDLKGPAPYAPTYVLDPDRSMYWRAPIEDAGMEETEMKDAEMKVQRGA